MIVSRSLRKNKQRPPYPDREYYFADRIIRFDEKFPAIDEKLIFPRKIIRRVVNPSLDLDT